MKVNLFFDVSDMLKKGWYVPLVEQMAEDTGDVGGRHKQSLVSSMRSWVVC